MSLAAARVLARALPPGLGAIVAAAAATPPAQETPMRTAVRNRTHLRSLVSGREVRLRFCVEDSRFHVRVTTGEADVLYRDAESKGCFMWAEVRAAGGPERLYLTIRKERQP